MKNGIYSKEMQSLMTPYRGSPDDPLNRWLDRNTAMGETPPTADELDYEIRQAQEEQYGKLERAKRYIYKAFYEVQFKGTSRWQQLEDVGVNNKDELATKLAELEKKYKAEVRLELSHSNW